jgi:ABC-2 type transport system ATP-binding protein
LTDASPVAVEARDVTFLYGSRQALAGVSFQVGSGEIYGFLGPNGGGKTTLFRILATQLQPAGGSVRVLGADVVDEAPLVRLQLGVVFQSPSLDVHLSVLENLIHQGHLYGLRHRKLAHRIDSLLERFGLSDRRNDRVKTLSGGLQRRVEIVKALLHRPRLLLLDEPSTGLDPGARHDLWAVLLELKSGSEVTILLTTHFMDEADRCDRLALVDGGKMVAEGAPVDLKQEIGGEVVLLKSRDPKSLAVDLEQKFGLEVTLRGDGVRFETTTAHELVGRLTEFFGRRIDAATISRPTLEDVFLQRTGHSLWEES